MPDRNRLLLLLVYCVLTLNAGIGCSAGQHGVVVVRLRDAEKSRMAETVYAGQYDLYAADSSRPRLHYYLKAGERIGFERTEMNVVAIAGSHRDIVPDAAYVWRREK